MICKLSDIVKTANTGADAIKKAPIVNEPTNLRCLRIGDVSQKRDFSMWGYTKTSEADYKRYKLHKGDSVIARTGNTIGVCIYIDDDVESVYNNGLIRLTVKKEFARARFLFYLIRSKACQDYIQSIAYGTSTQPNMKIKDFLNFDIDVPNLEMQDKIIEIIDSIESRIKVNTKINNNLVQQAKALYEEMFLNNPDTDMTAGVLSDIATITMGQSPSGSSYNEDGNGEVFYQGRAEFGFRFPNRRLFTTEPKRMAEIGDILLSVRAPVGDLNVAYERCCIGRGLGAIHSKTGNTSFVLYTMLALRPQLDVYNGEGTVFGSINRDALNALPIYIPSKDKICQFESIVRPMDDMIRTNCDEVRHLESLRESLLPKLMSGEIDISGIQL